MLLIVIQISMNSPADTLSIDIGGTGVKLIVLDSNGLPLCDRQREVTPQPATPSAVLDVIQALISKVPKFDRVSVGFPGVVHDGLVSTAPNLDPEWVGIHLGNQLGAMLMKPVRVANDADVQGFGCIQGQGLEMVLTLGTGMGSSLFINGCLVPNLELAHHQFRKGMTYEEYVGKRALESVGENKWTKRVLRVIENTKMVWNWESMHLGGGNAKLLKTLDLPQNIKIHSNKSGVLGAYGLWQKS